MCIFFAFVLTLLYYWHLHGWNRAALLASLLLILFFSYGHVYYAIKNLSLGDFIADRHRYLVVLWTILGLGSYFGIHDADLELLEDRSYLSNYHYPL